MSRRNMAAIRRSVNQRGPTTPPKLSNYENSLEKEKEKIRGVKLYPHADFETDWQPSMSSVLKLILSFRISSALWGIISDCDEVYNYWEPLHLFLYGSGFQTWEYSPLYAIRSYFYIYLHYLPANFISSLLGGSKVVVFVCVRCLLGLICLGGEYFLFTAMCKRITIASARNFVIFSIFSTGMFVASTAFLPSSFAMTLNFYLLGAYLNEQWWLAIGCTALSSMVGWPFVAVLGFPIVTDMILLRRKYFSFFFWALFYAAVFGASLYVCDSFYFGKPVFAPLNIVIYNVLSGPGPELYGVEPVSYYLKNLFLNWNLAIGLAAISLPVTMFTYLTFYNPSDAWRKMFGLPRDLEYWQRYTPVFLIWFTTAIWCAIFFTQPHKEERFLFPIYPHIAFLAGVTFDAILRQIAKRTNMGISNKCWSVMIIFIVLSVSRSFSVYRNYASHVEIYKSLNDNLMKQGFDSKYMNDPIRICVGKEWHRFPSSFFLPERVFDGKRNSRGVELRFLESEFRGLLPKHFLHAESLVEMTRNIPTEMNDMNKEERSRYVALNTCDYVIDLDMPASEREPDLRTMERNFDPIARFPFIVASKSHPIFRAFYVPYFSNIHTSWTNYTLYKAINWV